MKIEELPITYNKVIKILAKLNYRDIQILNLRFNQKVSQEEVASIFRLTRERIRQLEDKAIYKICQILNEKK